MKYTTLNEEILRMKSLMTEERLYGNLVDKENILTEVTGGRTFGKLGRYMDDVSANIPKFRDAGFRYKGTIEQMQNYRINDTNDLFKHLEEFGEVWRIIVPDKDLISAKKILQIINGAKYKGNLTLVDLFKKGSDGIMPIQYIPREGGIRQMVLNLVKDSGGKWAPDVTPINKPVTDLVVTTGPVGTSIVKRGKNNYLVPTKDGKLDLDPEGTIIIIAPDGKKIKTKPGGDSIEDIPWEDVTNAKTVDETINEIDMNAVNALDGGEIQFVNSGGGTVNINVASKSVDEVAEEIVEEGSKQLAKKSGISLSSMKKLLKTVAVDTPVISDLINPWAIGGVAKSNFTKNWFAVVSYRVGIHVLLYWLFIHRWCDKSNREKGGQDPELQNAFNMKADGSGGPFEGWLDGPFAPCFYPLFPVRLIKDQIVSVMNWRLGKTAENFCMDFDMDANGKKTGDKKCGGFLGVYASALSAVDQEYITDGTWCDKFGNKGPEDIFTELHDGAIKNVSESGYFEKAGLEFLSNIEMDTSENVLDIFKGNTVMWNTFNKNVAGNKLMCVGPEIHNEGKKQNSKRAKSRAIVIDNKTPEEPGGFWDDEKIPK